MNDKNSILDDTHTETQSSNPSENEINLLKEKIHFYENMIRAMPGNVYWKDINGKLLGFNDNVYRTMQGFKKVDPSGKTWEAVASAQSKDINQLIHFDYEKMLQADLDVMQNDKTIWLEENAFDPTGNPAIYYSQKTPLHNTKGDVIGLVGISIDISKQKRLEAQLRKEKEEAIKANLAKSRFLAVVNHEIRTPLSCIVSLVELLQETKLDDSATQLMGNLDDCAKHLLQLINSLLEFNRLELEQAPPELEPFDIRELTQSIHSMLHNAAIQKHIELIFDIHSTVPNFLIGDVRFVKHILINLINNSIKFTNEGSVALSVNYNQERKSLHLIVKDTGIGIAKENLNKIFLPFQQIKDTYVRDTAREGTGLGLSIVKALVDKLGGNIQLESELGKGSIFSIDFPCDSIDQLPEKKSHQATSSLPTNLKILMIEDDPTIQLIHQKIFSNLKIPLTIAKNALEGLAIIDQFDLLFLDLSLPDLSGFDVIEKIRSSQDHHKNIPIIVLTAYSENTEKNRALQLGANLFLSKPLNTIEIPNIIDSVLEKNKK